MVRQDSPQAFATTKVAPEKTKGQINQLLRKHGALSIRSTEGQHQTNPNRDQYVVEFIWSGERMAARVMVDWDNVSSADERRSLRALYWWIKAKLDAVEYGIEEFHIAFMPYLITDQGMTIAESPKRFADALPGGFTFSGGQLAPRQLASGGEPQEGEYREIEGD